MLAYICESVWQSRRSDRKPLKLYLNVLKSKLQNGMQAMKGESGTKSMGASVGKVVNLLQQSVLCVGKSIKHSFLAGLNFVLERVNNAETIRNTRLFLPCAPSAESLLSTTNIASKFVVPELVQTDCVQQTSVYNLTLDDVNAYYANGVLVDNCADALALTFAAPVARAVDVAIAERRQQAQKYDPLAW